MDCCGSGWDPPVEPCGSGNELSVSIKAGEFDGYLSGYQFEKKECFSYSQAKW
jgi:hypothetical protein